MWRARRRCAMYLAAGLLVGLSIGGALAAGVWIGNHSSGGPQAALNELRLKASASHGSDTLAIATGPIDDEVEGLFCLDCLSGELQCVVINPRTGGLGGWFKTNVVNDLPVEKGKKPAYLMVTGQIQTRGGTYGNARPAGSLVYVADANTGMIAVYTFGWAKGMSAAAVTQASDMKLLYKGKARGFTVRE